MSRWVRLAAAGVASLGCASARYRPLAPTEQAITTGHVTVARIVRREPTEDELELNMDLEPGTRLVNAGVSQFQNVCVQADPSLLLVDGTPRYSIEPPLVEGHHSLSLQTDSEFPKTLALETQRFGERYCDHLAVNWPEDWEREPFWYADVRISFLGMVPHYSVGGLRFMLAHWTGPLRFAAQVGIVNGKVCDDSNPCDGYFALPLAVEVARTFRIQAPLYALLGGRFTSVLLPETSNGPLRLEALALQLTSELIVARGFEKDPAPAGGVLAIGASVGPALVLGSDAGFGFAAGGELVYGFAP